MPRVINVLRAKESQRVSDHETDKCPDLPAALSHLITDSKRVSGELLPTDLATVSCSRALHTRLESSSPGMRKPC